ncbi:MAG TPA: TIGR03943 family protein [Pseudonocardiaceae bacterium]
MRRETQNVLLVLLGGAVVKICVNGDFTRYVKPSLQPWLLAAGVFTILIAVVGIVRDLRSGRDDDTHDTHGAHGAHEGAHDAHGHAHSSRSPWLLLLPALAIFLVAPPALGADKVIRSGSVSAPAPDPGGAGFVALPDEDAPVLKLGDAVTRAVWDDSGSLDGREIRLVGFVVVMGDGTVHLARLTIGCCAADAAPIKVRLTGPDVDAYPADTWLEVRGRMVPDSATEANHFVPTFDVTGLTPVAAPPDPYEY